MLNSEAISSPDSTYVNILHSCHDHQAVAYYEKHGASTVEHAFAIANILHIHSKVLEASYFYRVAFDLHGKTQTEFPLPQSLLQVRLLCLLKSSNAPPPEELEELATYSPALANYIRGIQIAWQDGKVGQGLDLIGNAFEIFHSGEEIDRLYLELALRYPPVGLRSGEDIASPNPIPPHLYMYWDRDPPEEIRDNIRYHQELLGTRFTIFDRESASKWLYDHYGKEISEIFRKVRHPAEGADLLRLYVIMANGGWWLDADLRIRSLEAWKKLTTGSIKECHLFATHNYVLHNDFFGAAPSNAIVSNAAMMALVNTFEHCGLYIAFKTGPGVLNRAVSRAIYNALQSHRPLCDLQIDDQHRFHETVEEYEVSYKHLGSSWHSA
ncbi:glycosyltransferase family 32 protein [Gluconobacter oxydans]|uniref:hypothetical protein n=1 Tax=Gluconobacter oxydans TaxID=442 RepID=UPI0007853337|nr:hypothetical protein [Gluconobacter oxydans]MCP1248956.1 hypothetical protein [Gluconobacter oxydans]WKE48853.1 hypothetical protein NUJ38_03785 [Gluconobacter oxydans]